MIIINIDPVAFSVGPFEVRWYGLMYVVGIVAGLLVAWPHAKFRGITRNQIETIALWSIPSGLIGARLYYVLQQPLGQYISDPWRIFAVWEGGMAFYGAVFAVLLAVIILTRQMKLNTWNFLDFAVIFGTVGQFFGRIGNVINGDIIGYPTSLPWGFVYQNPSSFPPRHDIAYQPAAIYEALINVIIFTILWLIRKKVKPGIIFFIYIFTYSIGQIIVFFWRDNEIVWLGLKQAQLTAMVVLILGIGAFAWFLIRQNKLKGHVE